MAKKTIIPGPPKIPASTMFPGKKLGKTLRMSTVYELSRRIRVVRREETILDSPGRPRKIPYDDKWLIERVAVEPTPGYLTAIDAAREGRERPDLGTLSIIVNGDVRASFAVMPLIDSYLSHETLKSIVGLERLARTLADDVVDALAGAGNDRAAQAVKDVKDAIQVVAIPTIGAVNVELEDMDECWIEASGDAPLWVQIHGKGKRPLSR